MQELDVIILTLNEEVNLPHCLKSLASLPTKVYVVDSGSTDMTTAIARDFGAEVYYRNFTNQAEQFNWALDNLPLKNEWAVRLDADEFILPELADELRQILPQLEKDVTGIYVKRRMVFMGRWIRHGGYYPTWLLRIFRNGKARSELAEMDEHIVLQSGGAIRLESDFVDHNRKGLSDWCLKHERYAARQARVMAAGTATDDPTALQGRLFGNQTERKRWVKNNLYRRAPLFTRAFAYFVYRYFLRLGILDGREGLIFHYLHAAWYLFYVDAKIYETRKKGS